MSRELYRPYTGVHAPYEDPYEGERGDAERHKDTGDFFGPGLQEQRLAWGKQIKLVANEGDPNARPRLVMITGIEAPTTWTLNLELFGQFPEGPIFAFPDNPYFVSTFGVQDAPIETFLYQDIHVVPGDTIIVRSPSRKDMDDIAAPDIVQVYASCVCTPGAPIGWRGLSVRTYEP